MINSADYSPDGKFLVLEKRYGQEESTQVPVALIDELIERGLSSYDLKNLLFVRRMTKGRKTRKVRISELVGEDLTGKTVGVYFRNYDDSEWMETGAAITVAQQEEQGGDFFFVFPADYTACYEGECSHYDDEDNPQDCLTDSLQGYYFWMQETVLVIEEEDN